MLELIARGIAPAALLLGQVDAILTLGIVVAGEMGHGTLPALEVAPEDLARLREGRIQVAPNGTISPAP
jgi:predicted aconitase with swiveling domain